MSPERPLPVMDLSANGWLTFVAAAGRSHVGNYRGQDRPKPNFSSEQLAWATASERRCLYCSGLQPTGGEEHVLSIALGNWFWVLPPNVVCDQCNSQGLSQLDTKLQLHPLIAMVRTLAGITGRSGQPPVVGASNIRLQRDGGGDLHIEVDHERHLTRSEQTLTVTPKWDNFGPRQRRVTARALLKLGLGTVWLARGPSEASRKRYDHVRQAILEDRDVPLQYGFGNSRLPGHAIQISCISHEMSPGLHVTLDYLGIKLWAETDGYWHEASSEFLEREIDVEFAEPQGASP